MAAVLFLIDRTRHRLIVCVSMWAALASLAVGLLLLLSEAHHAGARPAHVAELRAFHFVDDLRRMGRICGYGGVRGVGAAGDEAGGRVAGDEVEMVREARRGIAPGAGRRREHRAGAFVAVYTGMLLMSAGGVPLWNTPLLPALFTVSAFDTGVALVEIVAVLLSKKDALRLKARVIMERAVVVLVLVECVVMAAFLASMLGADGQTAMGATAASSAALLVSGGLAACFWGMVVVCGLVLPLVMAAAGLVLHRRGGKKPCPKRLQGALMAIGAAGRSDRRVRAALFDPRGGHSCRRGGRNGEEPDRVSEGAGTSLAILRVRTGSFRAAGSRCGMHFARAARLWYGGRACFECT